MRVFLTGATGYLGSAVLDALVRAGHEVGALVRSGQAAERASARGAHPVSGDLRDPESYRGAASGYDAYIHAAADDSPKRADVEQQTVDTLLSLAAATAPSTFIYTSGMWVLGTTRGPVDESAPYDPPALVAWRPALEQRVLAGAAGVRTAVVRPGLVYGGGSGLVSDMLTDADNGIMRVIGNGENHWVMVYDRDLADLYVRVLASAEASGLFHVTDESDETVRDIVEAIAAHTPTRPEVRYMPITEARKKMGPIADALVLDQIVRSPRARALGWSPSLGTITRNIPRMFEEWRNARQDARD